jgi:hypothetical protein
MIRDASAFAVAFPARAAGEASPLESGGVRRRAAAS